MINEREKSLLIAHILEQGKGELPTANDEFDNALFEARIKAFLNKTN